jgi:hypothetical protein
MAAKYREGAFDYLCGHCGTLLWREGEEASGCRCKYSARWGQAQFTRETYEAISHLPRIARTKGMSEERDDAIRAHLAAKQAKQREEANAERQEKGGDQVAEVHGRGEAGVCRAGSENAQERLFT